MAASVAGAIGAAADAVRAEILKLAQVDPDSPFGATRPGDVTLTDGQICQQERSIARSSRLSDAMRHGKVERIEQEAATRLEGEGNMPATRIPQSLPRSRWTSSSESYA